MPCANLVPHLEQLQMLGLWGRLWGRLGSRLWNGCFWKITPKQRAVGCSTKQNVVMSRRTHHKHDTAPLSLSNWHPTTLCLVSDHKTVVRKFRKSDGQTGSQCLAIIRRWPSSPVSHRQEITVLLSSTRGGAAATNRPEAAKPRSWVQKGGEAALSCARTSRALPLPPCWIGSCCHLGPCA